MVKKAQPSDKQSDIDFKGLAEYILKSYLDATSEENIHFLWEDFSIDDARVGKPFNETVFGLKCQKRALMGRKINHRLSRCY